MAAFRYWHSAFDLFTPSASCPPHLPEIRWWRDTFGSTSGYYQCLRREAWTHPPILAHVVRGLDAMWLAWTALLATWIVALASQAGVVRAPSSLREPSSAS